MSDSRKRTELHGATITAVESSEATRWIAWVLGTGPMPRDDASSEELCWLLAHCLDGVTWGRRDGQEPQQSWRLGSSVFPDLCPPVSNDNLLELRLFGPHGELLLWRDGRENPPGFRGRWLFDVGDKSPCDKDDPGRPHPEDRILLGHQRLGARGGFTRVGDGTGREQAVPLECQEADFGTKDQRRMPLRLRVWHYFETDEETGAVRVAATRLAHVFNAAAKEGNE